MDRHGSMSNSYNCRKSTKKLGAGLLTLPLSLHCPSFQPRITRQLLVHTLSAGKRRFRSPHLACLGILLVQILAVHLTQGLPATRLQFGSDVIGKGSDWSTTVDVPQTICLSTCALTVHVTTYALAFTDYAVILHQRP